MSDTKKFASTFEQPWGDLDDVMDEGSTDIISSNIIHDKYQFESQFDFDLKRHGKESEKSYDIDIYFFIPRDMEINSDNYSRDHFYGDLTNYLRIQTPELFNWNKATEETWRLPFCDRYFAVHLLTRNRQKLSGVVVQEVKMFCTFIDEQLKRTRNLVARLLRRNAMNNISNLSPAALREIDRRIRHILQMVQVYRNKYVKRVRSEDILCDQDVKRAFLLADEYLSYRQEIELVAVLQLLEKHAIQAPDHTRLIHATLTAELEYRTQNKIVHMQNLETARETYYYRLGLLKKYILQVLYVQTKNIKKEKFYRNMIAACGAGLAATWAVLTDIPRMQLANSQSDHDVWLRFALVLLIGVTAYIFKDRIKELSKEYFNQKLKPYIPDFDILMFYHYFTKDNENKKDFLGSCKEFFRYLQRSMVAPEIVYIRDIGNRSDLDPMRDEIIINYSKKVCFPVRVDEESGDALSKIQFIRDIIRFDISKFLAKLENPKKATSYFDTEKGIVVTDAPRVYHINVIFRYACQYQSNKKTDSLHVEFERIRLVLNKKGIVRIEEVLPRGCLGYSETKEL